MNLCYGSPTMVLYLYISLFRQSIMPLIVGIVLILVLVLEASVVVLVGEVLVLVLVLEATVLETSLVNKVF